MNCAATGPITVRIEQLSPMANGYIKLALLNVAGSNGISSVAIAPAGTQVSFAAQGAEHCLCLSIFLHAHQMSRCTMHQSLLGDSADNADAPKYPSFIMAQIRLYLRSRHESQKQAALLLDVVFGSKAPGPVGATQNIKKTDACLGVSACSHLSCDAAA